MGRNLRAGKGGDRRGSSALSSAAVVGVGVSRLGASTAGRAALEAQSATGGEGGVVSWICNAVAVAVAVAVARDASGGHSGRLATLSSAAT